MYVAIIVVVVVDKCYDGLALYAACTMCSFSYDTGLRQKPDCSFSPSSSAASVSLSLYSYIFAAGYFTKLHC